MCSTSASGCFRDGFAFTAALCKRAQSVLDFSQADLGFALRCLAEGDDADFIFGLRVNDRHRDADKQPQGYEPLLTLRKAIVFVRKDSPFEDAWRVIEIESVVFDVAGTLALRPCEPHSTV